jgi:hypothetical protein
MSFAFTIRAKSKAGVLKELDRRLVDVVANCPEHKADEALIKEVSNAYLGLLPPAPEKLDPPQAIELDLGGYLSWQRGPGQIDLRYAGARLGVSARLIPDTESISA